MNEVNLNQLERAVQYMELQAKAMRYALDTYKKNPAKYAPQLPNLQYIAADVSAVLTRLIINKL
jgi:hypothetical protein